MPMMATPVAIALVWTMMFHPQLGVLNYLLSLVGLPPQLWVFHPATVIPSLVLVETWQWTPLVMLIVLGGLAAIPTEPYESAQIDGASVWQMFRYITLPLITPFLFIAGMIRMIDAVKSFDIIFAITQGGPGSASETINLYLYSVAFIYYDLGYGSAIAVVFFLLDRGAGGHDALSAPAHAVDRDRRRRMSLRQILGKIGLWFAVFVIVSPAILFFLWMASLSLKFEVDNAAYPPVFIPRALCLEELRRRARVQPLPDLFRQQPDRDRQRDRARDAGRRARRLRDRAHGGAQIRDRDPDRAHHAGTVLSDSAVPDVPVARIARHAGAADHHPSGGDGADRDLDHDRLFRDHAAGARGSRPDRRRHALAGVPPCGAADRASRDLRSPSSSR